MFSKLGRRYLSKEEILSQRLLWLSICSLGGRCVRLLLSSISQDQHLLRSKCPKRSSLSRIQLTASCPALDTPCSPADFSVSVPHIATCWGPPGASWSPHFSLLTPEEEKVQSEFYQHRKGCGQTQSLLWLECRTSTSQALMCWNTGTSNTFTSVWVLLHGPME